jgi:DNA-binding transcriptional LysR family regulator
MTSDQVKYFLEIAKCLNYSMAAEELCISQSSLSKHIQNLEMELGVRLFTRTTKNDSDASGHRFHGARPDYAGRLSKHAGGYAEHIPQSRKSVALSSIPIMSIYKITEMIAAFNEIYPDITIEIIEEDTIYVIQHLREQKADIALAVTKS